MHEIERCHEVAEKVRKILRDKEASGDLGGVDRKLAPDVVVATGFGFGFELDGEQFVICVEKV